MRSADVLWGGSFLAGKATGRFVPVVHVQGLFYDMMGTQVYLQGCPPAYQLPLIVSAGVTVHSLWIHANLAARDEQTILDPLMDMWKRYISN